MEGAEVASGLPTGLSCSHLGRIFEALAARFGHLAGKFDQKLLIFDQISSIIVDFWPKIGIFLLDMGFWPNLAGKSETFGRKSEKFVDNPGGFVFLFLDDRESRNCAENRHFGHSRLDIFY